MGHARRSPNALERETMGGPILRHGPNISHNLLGTTFRHPRQLEPIHPLETSTLSGRCRALHAPRRKQLGGFPRASYPRCGLPPGERWCYWQ